MDIDTSTKIVTAILGIWGAGKIFYDITLGKRAKLRDEYKFAKEFLQDVEKNPNLHPYLKEKGFQAIAGDNTLNAEDINHLLTLQDADKRLKSYRLAKKYLDNPRFENDKVVHFKNKYLNQHYRLLLKFLYISLYVICGLLSVSPYLFSQKLHLASEQIFISILITFPTLAYFAFELLREFIFILQAEDLVKNQKKNTKKRK